MANDSHSIPDIIAGFAPRSGHKYQINMSENVSTPAVSANKAAESSKAEVGEKNDHPNGS